jgi:hypothetical protein
MGNAGQSNRTPAATIVGVTVLTAVAGSAAGRLPAEAAPG